MDNLIIQPKDHIVCLPVIQLCNRIFQKIRTDTFDRHIVINMIDDIDGIVSDGRFNGHMGNVTVKCDIVLNKNGIKFWAILLKNHSVIL